MLAGISSRQLTEWMAYFGLEHLGQSPEERADLRAGIIAATIVNVNRGKSKPAVRPEEFMPFAEKPKQRPEELLASMKALAANDAKRTVNRTVKGKPNGDAGRPAGHPEFG